MSLPSLLLHFRHAESLSEQCRRGSRYFRTTADRQPFLHMRDRGVPLSPRGAKHAHRASRELISRFGMLDCIMNSTFERSRQTARILLQEYPENVSDSITVLEQPLLDERDMGRTFLMTEEEVRFEFPWLDQAWLNKGELETRYPDGENMREVCSRMNELLQELHAWSGSRVCLVGHWGTHFGLLYHLARWEDSQMLRAFGAEFPPSCSITVYERGGDPDSLVLREKNLQLG